MYALVLKAGATYKYVVEKTTLVASNSQVYELHVICSIDDLPNCLICCGLPNKTGWHGENY